MLDPKPATTELARVIEGIRDDQLSNPTPCPEATLADLLDHADGLAIAFTMAAIKEFPSSGTRGPSSDGSRLGTDWRTRIPGRLDGLAEAWREPTAWEGMTEAGGQQLPGQVAGVVALNEVIVHGWDLAVASGQDFRCDDALVQAARGFVQSSVEQNPKGTPGLFGPPVAVPDDASPLDQLIGLTGRDPSWAAHERQP
jgi:uncharacterized protein (TIGR03086 family)